MNLQRFLDLPIEKRVILSSLSTINDTPTIRQINHGIIKIWARGYFWGLLTAFWLWFLFAFDAPR